MTKSILYMKLEQTVETTKNDVFLKDIGRFVCQDERIKEKAKSLKIYSFTEQSEERVVISVMKVIQVLQTALPELLIQNVGETDVVIKRILEKKESKNMLIVKIALVSAVCFFGTTFTIMAFHNDIGINKMFLHLYEMITGKESDGYTILELTYSVGLALGIIVFFNHVGPRRITKDPTPVEVEMRLYENDVNTSIVETANREGKNIDVS